MRDDIGHGVTKILYALSRRQGNIRGHNCWSSVVASARSAGLFVENIHVTAVVQIIKNLKQYTTVLFVGTAYTMVRNI